MGLLGGDFLNERKWYNSLGFLGLAGLAGAGLTGVALHQLLKKKKEEQKQMEFNELMKTASDVVWYYECLIK
jgi:hypothetical protein